MPFKITLSGSGLFAFIRFNDTGVRAEIVADITAQAQGQAFTEWCQRSGDLSLRERFEPSAFASKGLAPRSLDYQAKQRKWIGVVTPYVSPRQPDLLRVAKAITAPHPKARQILRALATQTEHARVLVMIPGSGYNVRTTGSKRVVRTTLTLPGMRILNRIPGYFGKLYREQFLGFNAGGRRDGQWISARANELALSRIIAFIKAMRRRQFPEAI